MAKNLILVTSGEPAGIGPDICLDLAVVEFAYSNSAIIVLGDALLLQERAQLLNKDVAVVKIDPTALADYHNQYGQLLVWDIPCSNRACVGQLDVTNVNYVLTLLDMAIEICQRGLAQSIVTAPISKEIINQAGISFSGHTEYLAQKFGCSKVVMMLLTSKLKVALLTTHLPLKEVPLHITQQNLNQTVAIIISSFKHYYGIVNPRIGVCGLNPHAGEGGYLGDEELTIINPVIQAWQAKGYQIFGSYPADTIFTHAADFDVILAMYHDQGLPVLKYSGFDEGVNVTLGLPIIRTSVDHGTALSLAGTGRASSKSLIQAIQCALESAVV
jgi:4-hydroxythreonine-4-phosphate dehydrogenase